MKKIIAKVVSVALIASMAFAFAGCGKKKLNTEGKLIMATNAEFEPYEFKDGNAIVGIDAEIAAALADKLGLELVIEDVAFDSIITGVQSGKYDMGMAGMTVTESRKKSVSFTDTYATGVQVIIVPEGSDITDADILCSGDYKVGVQQGTTGDIYMSDTPENGGVGEDMVTRYKSGNEAVLDLQKGGVDAVVIDNEPAKALVAANEGLKILETPFTEEDYAICVRLDNEELRDEINQALKELKEDGTIDAIVAKYIHA